VGGGKNALVDQPLPAAESALRAPRGHTSGVPGSRMRSHLLALRSVLMLGALNAQHTLSASSYTLKGPSGSTLLRFPWTHLGSMALSHGLCLGKKQLTILTPSPLWLTPRLCYPSQRLISLQMRRVSPALSLMRTMTFFPAAPSFSQLHWRNYLDFSAHRPAVDESQPRLIEFGQVRVRSRRWPSDRGRLWRPTAG
jgi:hypothetical protein